MVLELYLKNYMTLDMLNPVLEGNIILPVSLHLSDIFRFFFKALEIINTIDTSHFTMCVGKN